MKAIVQPLYGSPDVLQLRDVERPSLEDDRVLVRVRASSVNAADWHMLRGRPLFARLMMGGLRRPKRQIPGVDAAGIVEAAGKAVTDLRPGDEVFGARDGAFAEYVCGRMFVSKPPNVTFEQAAAVPAAGCTALQAVRDHADVQPGQRVLVNGAGGGVGTFLVQVAKAFGAHVTATTSSDKLELVRSLGADAVIDHTRQDFTRGAERYDVVFDVGGTPSLGACRRALLPDGTLVLVGAGRGPLGVLTRPIAAIARRRLFRQRIVVFLARLKKEDLVVLKELLEQGALRPIVDRSFPLHEAADALRHLGSGRARGKVVITMADGNAA